jgi:hypothetical protein
MIKIYLVLSLSFFLTSCINGVPIVVSVGDGINYHEYGQWSEAKVANPIEKVGENETIIITKVGNNILINSPAIDRGWESLGATWVNKDSDGNLISIKSNQYERGIFKIRSGDYFLISVGNIAMVDIDDSGFGLSHRRSFTFTYRDSSFFENRLENNEGFISPKYLVDKQGLPPLASFKVRPQEIVYIGDLELKTEVIGWFSGKVNFEVRDKYFDAVKDFRKRYPQFRDRPVLKRLVSLGTFVNEDGNVKFSAHPREVLMGRFKSK